MYEHPEFLDSLPKQEFAAKEVVIAQGSRRTPLYFLERGGVRVEKDGVEIAKVTDPGAVFGEMSLLLDEPATASVVAAKQTTLCRVDDPRNYLKEHPDVMFYVSGLLAMRLDRLNRYLVDVKDQFADRSDHLGMMDEVLDALMASHPRKIARRAFEE